MNKPLYPGSPLTLCGSLLFIFTFIIPHKLSNSCLADLLALIASHCISPNLCVKTLYKFKRIFSKNNTEIKKHYFCSRCYVKVLDSKSICTTCQENTEINYFIEFPIVDQLEKILNRPDIKNKLVPSIKNLQKTIPENLEDIHDGSVYRKFRDSAIKFWRNYINVWFTWNSDGISLFNSSQFSIWSFFYN